MAWSVLIQFSSLDSCGTGPQSCGTPGSPLRQDSRSWFPMMWFPRACWALLVQSGTSRWRTVGASTASRTAMAMTTAPAERRKAVWWDRNQSLMRLPPRANMDSGMAAPMANAMVSAMIEASISPVAAATVMAARTGPAHGTYTAPRANPTTKPPRPCALVRSAWRRGSRSNGACTHSPSTGMSMPRPTRTSNPMPTQRTVSWGSPNKLSTIEPLRVIAAKLTTMPATT